MSQTANIPPRHRPWVRTTHWLLTIAFLLLAFSGTEIAMVHPRFYWGEAGNDLTPALFEIPISRNYKHHGFTQPKPFYNSAHSPVSAGRTYDIFNQNGWGRSLHFLSAWILVIMGTVYLLLGIFTGHFRRRIWPAKGDAGFGHWWRDWKAHFSKQLKDSWQQYGPLQKLTYSIVIFGLFPLAVLTGFTMSPAITAAYPWLLTIFLGGQSARTIHFLASISLEIFLVVHLLMVIRTGFSQQIKAMTIG